jgi:hypothetical protein
MLEVYLYSPICLHDVVKYTDNIGFYQEMKMKFSDVLRGLRKSDLFILVPVIFKCCIYYGHKDASSSVRNGDCYVIIRKLLDYIFNIFQVFNLQASGNLSEANDKFSFNFI